MLTFLDENNLYFLLIIVIIILIFGFLYIKNLKTEKDRKLELIIGITASVSIILVMYNLIINTNSNKRIEKNRTTHNTLENIQRNWLTPQIELAQLYPEGFYLFKSLTPDTDHGNIEPIDYDQAKRIQIEIASSIRIFQAMEDFLSLGSNDITGKDIWVNNFLMWLQSPILRKNWETLSFNYSKDTRKFIDKLILESDKLILLRQKNNKLTRDDYDQISKNFQVHFR
ncbi:hypothetical protein [Aurantibacter sp.]|uniref:hypothetical protein n=1 Tax=Aurantibacter sp. TaxID=2807103 RepID=UPI0035C7B782